jgi:hypothetical protein
VDGTSGTPRAMSMKTKVKLCSSKLSRAVSFASLLRSGLGAVLLWAGLLKLSQSHAFLISVYEYQVFSKNFGLLIALYVPYFEVILGLCLVLGWFLDGALICATFLLMAFAGIIATTLYRGLDVTCGCFPGMSVESHIDIGVLIRTCVLAGISVGTTSLHFTHRRSVRI